MARKKTQRVSQQTLAAKPACGCAATQHELFTNCLTCGRVMCVREGPGPCPFCGTLVLSAAQQRELALKLAAARDGGAESFESAAARKETLLEYDRTSAERTKVRDEANDFDYNSIMQNQWLTHAERMQRLAAWRAEERKREAIARRKRSGRTKVTLDLVNRTVVQVEDDSDPSDQEPESDLVAEEEPAPLPARSTRKFENPLISVKPVFRLPEEAAPAADDTSSGKSAKKVKEDDDSEKFFAARRARPDATGGQKTLRKEIKRIQHDYDVDMLDL